MNYSIQTIHETDLGTVTQTLFDFGDYKRKDPFAVITRTVKKRDIIETEDTQIGNLTIVGQKSITVKPQYDLQSLDIVQHDGLFVGKFYARVKQIDEKNYEINTEDLNQEEFKKYLNDSLEKKTESDSEKEK